MPTSSVLSAHNVRTMGNPEGQVLLFAHGFGCDQRMWRYVTPAFTDRYRIVLFDYVGAGAATRTFDPQRYAELTGYADDVVEIVQALDLRNVVFIGHSVSAMIGVLAAKRAPDRFSKTVMIGPSPRYIDDEGYVGGFAPEDIEELLDNLESNYLGWSGAITPVIMGNADRPELTEELNNSFCRMDPTIAHTFAEATFKADNRADLPGHHLPTLVLQCREDHIAGEAVGEYTAAHLPQATLVRLQATGHCPHLSAPQETIAAISAFL